MDKEIQKIFDDLGINPKYKKRFGIVFLKIQNFTR